MGTGAIKAGEMELDLAVGWEKALTLGPVSVPNQSFEFEQINSTSLSCSFFICKMKISPALYNLE